MLAQKLQRRCQIADYRKSGFLQIGCGRCVADCFEDASIFAIDLATSLEYRIEKCVTSGAAKCNFFDIEETFVLLCGEKLDSGRIKMNEGALEEHGAKEFELFFKKCVL